MAESGDRCVHPESSLVERVVLDPKVMFGKPVIRGTRLPVELVLRRLAQGTSVDDLLGEYRGLLREDVQACLLFAALALEGSSLLPLSRNP